MNKRKKGRREARGMDKADEKNYNKGRRWLSKKQRERKGAGLPQAPTE